MSAKKNRGLSDVAWSVGLILLLTLSAMAASHSTAPSVHIVNLFVAAVLVMLVAGCSLVRAPVGISILRLLCVGASGVTESSPVLAGRIPGRSNYAGGGGLRLRNGAPPAHASDLLAGRRMLDGRSRLAFRRMGARISVAVNIETSRLVTTGSDSGRCSRPRGVRDSGATVAPTMP